MLTYAEQVKRMRADARYKEAVGNQLMLWVSMYADVCRRMLTYADVC